MQETSLLDRTSIMKVDRSRMAADASGGRLRLNANSVSAQAVGSGRCGGQMRDVFREWVTRSDVGNADI